MDTSLLEQRIIEAVQVIMKEAQPKYKTVQYYLEHKEGYREKANKWSLESYYRNKEKVLAKKKERYENDPEFRARCKERAIKSRQKKRLLKEAEKQNNDVPS
jgi:hypothetical protein